MTAAKVHWNMSAVLSAAATRKGYRFVAMLMPAEGSWYVMHVVTPASVERTILEGIAQTFANHTHGTDGPFDTLELAQDAAARFCRRAPVPKASCDCTEHAAE